MFIYYFPVLYFGSMSSKLFPKLSRWIPLWQRQIPRYPLWWKGDPQLRIFLPLFWMKMVKQETKLPDNVVVFEVHSQMTKDDVSNYLEKIYNVPVQSVRTTLLKPEERKHPYKGHNIEPDHAKRIAFVTLGKGETFEFPDIFKKHPTQDAKDMKEYKKLSRQLKEEEQKNWNKLDIPKWFS